MRKNVAKACYSLPSCGARCGLENARNDEPAGQYGYFCHIILTQNWVKRGGSVGNSTHFVTQRALHCVILREIYLFIYYRFTPLHNKQIMKWNKLTLLQQTKKTNKKTNKNKNKNKTKQNKKSCGEGDNQKHQCAILGMPPRNCNYR